MTQWVCMQASRGGQPAHSMGRDWVIGQLGHARGCLAVSDVASALTSYSSPAMLFCIEYTAQSEDKGALLHAHQPGQTWPTLEHFSSVTTLYTRYHPAKQSTTDCEDCW